jgi:lipoprotein-releasing system ATP-binding protein
MTLKDLAYVPVLELKKVSKSFSASNSITNVLSEIDCTVRPGQIVSIIGRSGSGKSTLLHILGMLDKPSAGKVVFQGKECNDLSDNRLTAIRRNHIGFVYQQHHLLPEFNALDNLQIAQLIKYKSDKKIALEMLDKFNLRDKASNYPAQLSGGENQRVAIARALINNPAVLLADEPTGNLDEINAEIVFELLLSNVRMHNLAAVIVTHNMELAKKTDIVMILENGRLKAK